MEIALGEKIKINDEEVPEYLLKALYENLKIKYEENSHLKGSFVAGGNIASGGTKASSFI
ncbi:hypothetical protein [Basfia succiniciproducens]|uniref:hypothetical protein n=1 Tax=Basfia succiniciproducens TaxID=653940 RepID=UPI000C1BB230|nr:hypothetical protein [Basfia succiniciproducens]